MLKGFGDPSEIDRLCRGQRGFASAARVRRGTVVSTIRPDRLRDRHGCLLSPPARLIGTPFRWPPAFVLGAIAYGIYMMAIVELGERFSGSMLVAGNATFALMWGIGRHGRAIGHRHGHGSGRRARSAARLGVGQLLLRKLLKRQALGGLLVPPALDQDVENDASLVDGAPQPVLHAGNGDDHLIEMPLVPGTG